MSLSISGILKTISVLLLVFALANLGGIYFSLDRMHGDGRMSTSPASSAGPRSGS